MSKPGLGLITIYSKTKEEFGWVDIPDTERLIVKTQLAQQSSQFEESSEPQVELNKQETEFERLSHLGLTLLYESASIPTESRMHALDVVTRLFIFFLDKPMREECNMLLCCLHSNTQLYYEHKDEAICSFVVGMLYLTPITHLSPDFYQHVSSYCC
ncbi:hypothetical protein LOD99_3106 [Oopsacas minuta]|uniref:Uncharacterized protein n=1 Tax=Oopsacas minuta TaxID=111878 RepID=A0AAV7JZL5_9METZ|nr:hypothetical protein LOD99_3106 [Oopsacas minuta]